MLLSEVLSRDSMHEDYEDYGKRFPKLYFFLFFFAKMHIFAKKDMHLNETEKV